MDFEPETDNSKELVSIPDSMYRGQTGNFETTNTEYDDTRHNSTRQII